MPKPRQLQIPGEDVAIADRRRKVWELLAQFKTPATIAKELGVARNTVYKDKTAVLREVHANTGANAETWRNELTGQLQTLLERWGPLATAEDLAVQGEKINKKGEREIIELEAWESGATAAEIFLKTIREIAKLQGAYTGEIGSKETKPLSLRFNFVQSISKLTQEPVKAEIIEAEIPTTPET